MRGIAVAVLALSLAGCFHDTRPSDERSGSGLFDSTPSYQAPEKDRCQSYGRQSGAQPDIKKQCDEAREVAQQYVRRLSPGDEVCLENYFGDEPGPACLARATVRDASTTQVLIKVENAKPASRWYKKLAADIWFDNGALVDLYLAEHGY